MPEIVPFTRQLTMRQLYDAIRHQCDSSGLSRKDVELVLNAVYYAHNEDDTRNEWSEARDLDEDDE